MARRIDATATRPGSQYFDLAAALSAPTRDELLRRLRCLPADAAAQLPSELAALLGTADTSVPAAIGAFYTPPTVVALACREALIAHLGERVAGLGTDAARELV